VTVPTAPLGPARMKRLLPCLTAVFAWSGDLHAADYLRDVKPLLQERCWACHGALKQSGKLRLDTGAALLRGGRNGPAVRPATRRRACSYSASAPPTPPTACRRRASR
jgi:hypothetical protein